MSETIRCCAQKSSISWVSPIRRFRTCRLRRFMISRPAATSVLFSANRAHRRPVEAEQPEVGVVVVVGGRTPCRG